MSELQPLVWLDFGIDAIKLTKQEVITLNKQVSEWRVFEEKKIQKLQREFEFNNFVTALDFTNRLGKLSETYNHHPQIMLEWGKVTLTWWSHKLNGLHQNDFFLAAQSELLYQECKIN